MAGLFLGVFAPPVRCVAVIESAGARVSISRRERVRAVDNSA
jgi:hypothetical protein